MRGGGCGPASRLRQMSGLYRGGWGTLAAHTLTAFHVGLGSDQPLGQALLCLRVPLPQPLFLRCLRRVRACRAASAPPPPLPCLAPHPHQDFQRGWLHEDVDGPQVRLL